MTLTIKKTIVVEEEVDVQLPLYWRLDNWFSKLEEFLVPYDNELSKYSFQVTSVSNNCITCTLMTLDQFEAYYGHYRGLYEKITEQEYQAEFDKLNNYLK